MLRLTNIQLPLDHEEADLKLAILDTLSISDDQLIDFTVHKRGYDARKKAKIVLIYTLDVDTRLNEELLEKFAKDSQVLLPKHQKTYHNDLLLLDLVHVAYLSD
jgi:uncharacterized FAD-dependent dehydrogenase